MTWHICPKIINLLYHIRQASIRFFPQHFPVLLETNSAAYRLPLRMDIYFLQLTVDTSLVRHTCKDLVQHWLKKMQTFLQCAYFKAYLTFLKKNGQKKQTDTFPQYLEDKNNRPRQWQHTFGTHKYFTCLRKKVTHWHKCLTQGWAI